jgi:adenine deaminase
MVVIGTNLDDMVRAANEVIEMQGGIAMVADGEVVGRLRLSVAGLITDELTADQVAESMSQLTELSRSELGIQIDAPFMQLGFISLATRPGWKLTDQGLIVSGTTAIQPALLAA